MVYALAHNFLPIYLKNILISHFNNVLGTNKTAKQFFVIQRNITIFHLELFFVKRMWYYHWNMLSIYSLMSISASILFALYYQKISWYPFLISNDSLELMRNICYHICTSMERFRKGSRGSPKIYVCYKRNVHTRTPTIIFIAIYCWPFEFDRTNNFHYTFLA